MAKDIMYYFHLIKLLYPRGTFHDDMVNLIAHFSDIITAIETEVYSRRYSQVA